jgi:hypothetical protein
MSAQPAFTLTWRVGEYRATLECPRPRPGHTQCLVMSWEPSVPTRLSADEIQQYRAGRDSAVADLAEAMRVNVAVVDL